MAISPLFRTLPDVNFGAPNDGDVFAWNAAQGRLVPVSQAGSISYAYLRGSDGVGAGIGTSALVDLSGALETDVSADIVINGTQLDVPAGVYQLALTGYMEEGLLAVLSDPGGAFGPHASLSCSAFADSFVRLFAFADPVTVANYSGFQNSKTVIVTLAAPTSLTFSLQNDLSAGSAVTVFYFISLLKIQ